MNPNTYFNLSSVQVSRLPVAIAQIEGYFKGTTADAWLQLHDTCTTPANNTVPLWQIPIAQTSQFFENLQVSHLPITEGVFIGISTTEGQWTASIDTMDVTVMTEKPVVFTPIVGDKVTPRTQLQVWAEADNTSGLKRLYGIIANVQTSAGFILVYADDATTGTILASMPIPANSTRRLYFGTGVNGLSPRTAGTNSNTASVVGFRQGCTVVLAGSVPPAGVAPTLFTNFAHILAITN